MKLLERLYEYQSGNVGEYRFPITRGVTQRHILSPLLFNVVLEHLMHEWKTRLRSHGFCLHPGNEYERLTDIRSADNISLFGKCLTELVSMLELLLEVLEEYGLILIVQKTNILSIEPAPSGPCYCDTKCGTIEILSESQKHKYLGRMFGENIRIRGRVASGFRISCGWMKYHALRNVFGDKHAPIKLRLEIFNSFITAIVLYSLEACPLTINSL